MGDDDEESTASRTRSGRRRMASPWAWAWTAWTRTPWGSGTVRSSATTTARCRRRGRRRRRTARRRRRGQRRRRGPPSWPGGYHRGEPAAASRRGVRMGGANELDQRARAGPRHGGSATSREPPVDGGGAGIPGARRRRRRARPGRGGIRATSSRCAGRDDDAGRDAAGGASDHAGPRGRERCRETRPPRSSPTRRGDPAPTPPSPGPPRTPCCSARGSATRVSPRGPPTPPRTRPRPAPAPRSVGPAVRRRRRSTAGRPADGVASVVLASISGEMSRLAVAPGGGDFRGAGAARRAARAHGPGSWSAGGGVARVPAPHRARVRPSQ